MSECTHQVRQPAPQALRVGRAAESRAQAVGADTRLRTGGRAGGLASLARAAGLPRRVWLLRPFIRDGPFGPAGSDAKGFRGKAQVSRAGALRRAACTKGALRRMFTGSLPTDGCPRLLESVDPHEHEKKRQPHPHLRRDQTYRVARQRGRAVRDGTGGLAQPCLHCAAGRTWSRARARGSRRQANGTEAPRRTNTSLS